MPGRERFAADEPFFSVLTAPKYRSANLTPDARREFYETGEQLVDYLFRLIEQRLNPDFAPTSILEYGCGVGRLAFPLARRAAVRGGNVIAVDSSPAMLDFSRREAAERRVGNVTFLSVEDFEGAGNHTYDFICCYLVVQRMPPATGLAVVERLLWRLAPGGVAAFLVPYASTASAAVRALRWARQHVPAVNALVNISRGRPTGEPFMPTHVYDLSRLVDVMQRVTGGTANALLEPHEGVSTALIVIESPMAVAGGKPGRAQPIAVDELIRSTSIEELNQSAEEYFSTLQSWDHHLAKPFAHAEEAPRLLGGLAVLLQGLDVVPGCRVLEFGAGTGWLSRALTQLGCRIVALDVSPTALEMARETYRRLPVVGEKPAPEFLLFDGVHIDLPDGSVDRIVCFHAFHHVANPDDVIREFGRVLAPGGIAAFAEPGPRHSRSSFSQFEMQAYKVVENDVDVHRVWRVARDAGFSDIKLAVFQGAPFHVSLERFEDFLAGGETADRWTASTRVFLRNMRTFFLVKEGAARVDSRRAEALACVIHAEPEGRAVEGRPFTVAVRVTNTGTATWLAGDVVPGGVRIAARLYDAAGALLLPDAAQAPPGNDRREIAPRETGQATLSIPAQLRGSYVVEIDCVAEEIAWFGAMGSKPFRLPVTVAAPD